MAVDCHALTAKTAKNGRRIPQDVRHLIADFVCGKPSVIPQDILERCEEASTIADVWPAAQRWELIDAFECETAHLNHLGRKIHYYCVRTAIEVYLKTDIESLRFLATLGPLWAHTQSGRRHVGHGLFTQGMAKEVTEGRITSLCVMSGCGGDRDPTPAEFAAHPGCHPTETRSIQTRRAEAQG
jgi:hypothetical protein